MGRACDVCLWTVYGSSRGSCLLDEYEYCSTSWQAKDKMGGFEIISDSRLMYPREHYQVPGIIHRCLNVSMSMPPFLMSACLT